MLFAGIVVLGYLLGSCPWGYWLVKLVRHEDIRTIGSGNIGASNVFRSAGVKLGVPVIALDVLKGFAPAFLGVHAVSHLCGIAAGAAAMAGHWRPLFLRFAKGGKMIATAGGTFFAVAPLAAGSGVVVWLALWALLGFPSIASLATTLFMPVASWAYGYPRPVIAFGAATFVAAVYLHRANIDRLVHGTENRSRIALLPRLFSVIGAR